MNWTKRRIAPQYANRRDLSGPKRPPASAFMRVLVTCCWLGLLPIVLFSSAQRTLAVTTTISVDTAAKLHKALKNAQPGQTIVLADGVYQGNFTATQDGTSQQPITLQGSAAAILEGESVSSGYVLHVEGADYWVLTGFSIRNGAKGLVLDNADYNMVDHLQVYQIGQEAIHFRTCSANNTLRSSTIRDTGLVDPGFGEGVYIGSDDHLWPTYSCDANQRDKSHYNKILSNHFGPNIRAEAIDVKEGTVGGVILDNEFDATGLSGEHYADSWVDIKGNRYKVGRNHGSRGNKTQLKHGFEVHSKAERWGRHNIFYGNVADLNSSGYGFHIVTVNGMSNPGNIVYTDNQVIGAASGVANIPVTNSGSARSIDSDEPLPDMEDAAEPLLFTPIATVWLPLIVCPPQ